MSRPRSRLARLESLYDLKRWGELLAAARRLLADDAEDSMVWGYVGVALIELNEDHEALEALEKACSFDPTNAWAFRTRSMCLQGLDRLDEALKVGEIALELAPEDPHSHIRVSRLARLTGNRARAWSAAERARELAPEEVRVWQNLGWNASKEHRWADALAHLENGLSLEPNNAALHESTGDALKYLDRRTDAADHYRRAVAINPRAASAYVELSQLYFEDGREEEAFDVLRRLAVASPNDSHVRYRLPDKLLMYDRNDEALATAKKAIDALPRDPDMWCMLARCEERAGDLEAAEASCARAIELSPTSAYALRMHALRLRELGRHNEALGRAREALAAERGEPMNGLVVATMLLATGARDAALAQVEAVMKEHPEVGYVWADLTRMALALGDAARARTAVEELLRRRPKILRNWNLAMRAAWHAGDLAYLRELRAGIAALPAERSRFGIRLLEEARIQCDVFEALLEERFEDARTAIARGLEGASRVDEFGCAMACALGIVHHRLGDAAEAARIRARGEVGPHRTKRCRDADCPDGALLDRRA